MFHLLILLTFFGCNLAQRSSFSLSFQFLGLVHWGLIAATPYMKEPVYGWVMFVAITLWLLTITLFFLNLFSAQRYLPAVPWSNMVGTDEGSREEGKEQTELCYEEKSCDLFCFFARLKM